MAPGDEPIRRGSYRDAALEFPERSSPVHAGGDRCPTCGRFRRGSMRASSRGMREHLAEALDGMLAVYHDPEMLRVAVHDLAVQLREPVKAPRPRRRRG